MLAPGVLVALRALGGRHHQLGAVPLAGACQQRDRQCRNQCEHGGSVHMAEEIADYLHGCVCNVQAKEGLHPLNGAYHAVPGLGNSLLPPAGKRQPEPPTVFR